MPPHRYTAYGLCIESELALAGLMPGRDGEPDITIRYGNVPTSLPYPSDMGVVWQSGPTEQLLSVVNVARYLILNRREIVIEEEPGGRSEDVPTFLLGSILSALLYARQIAVVHAGVIHTDRGAVLFMGRSGVGKSTLLGAMLKRGYAMLSDDKACIVINAAGVAEILPGFPTMRLTPETVVQLQYPLQEADGELRMNKHVLRVERFHNAASPLRVAYALHTHNRDEFRFEPLTGIGAFEALRHNLYRRRFVIGEVQRKAVFRVFSAAALQAPVVRVVRPEYPCLVDELADRIEADLSLREAAVPVA